MKSNKNLVLIGMAGAGKSTMGSILSIKLNLEFIDIDQQIETKTNKKISDIFKEKGEDYFRNIEEKISIDKLKLNNKIISLGGGAFLNSKIREEVLSNNLSFWLRWKNTTLINRLKKNKKRPLVLSLSDNEIKNLIIERSKIYSMANFKINCENLTKNEIVEKIINFYEEN